MKLKQLLVPFGENLKSTKRLKNFSQSSRRMVAIWKANGQNSLRNHTLEVVSRWFFQYSACGLFNFCVAKMVVYEISVMPYSVQHSPFKNTKCTFGNPKFHDKISFSFL